MCSEIDKHTRDIICGMDAQLFEERPPAPERKLIDMKPGEPICIDAVWGKPWWKRMLGYLTNSGD